MNKTILIVEDELKLAGLMSDYLAQAGFHTHIIDNGLDVADWVRSHKPDLMILDLMLPGKDGMAVCREVRGFSSVPIIMATARVEEIDRLLGLEAGADDYVCKPFSYREVVARVHAILRRVASANPAAAVPVDGLQLDEQKYQALWQGQAINLTAVEFRLLATLAREPGRIFNREQLMQNIYSEHRVVSDRTIDSHIKKLRQKVHGVVADRELIHSIYGVGYKYEV